MFILGTFAPSRPRPWLLALLLLVCSLAWAHAPHVHDSPERPGLLFVDYRHLEGGADGVAIIDLDPESAQFGEILQIVELGVDVLPHHLYFNHDESRLYTTALGGAFLYEVLLEFDSHGLPRMLAIEPVDVGENTVGENMFFLRDGSRYYMTFMGGQGGDRGGSVGVFDAETNALIKSIVAPVPEEGMTGVPFILYPHGISANEDLGLMMVTSTIHHDLTTGVGNTVTLIDLETDEPVMTYLVADSSEDVTAPVEVIMLRDDLPPYALSTTMLGGDVWLAAFDADAGLYGDFVRVLRGEDEGLSWPLEFYIHTDASGERELYISFGLPGVVNVYGLEDLPNLPLRRTLPAGAGAHHMVFFTTPSGREVLVVQNNLLNLDGLNAGTLTVVDIHSAEVLATLDLAGEHGLMPESIESVYGHGHDYHH